jgi:hypothetical protein
VCCDSAATARRHATEDELVEIVSYSDSQRRGINLIQKLCHRSQRQAATNAPAGNVEAGL